MLAVVINNPFFVKPSQSVILVGIWLFVLEATGCPCFGQETPPEFLNPYRESAAAWESEIVKLEAIDQSEIAGPNDILFVGSSSIRLWESITEDLHGISVVRRGYGGARFSDLAIFLDRVLANHHPKGIVYFVANDISGNVERDITPAQVAELAGFILQQTRQRFPDADIFFIETTPTPSRREHWPKISIANDLIRDLTGNDDCCHFIETRAAFLNDSGEPRQELFRDDQLHLNADGYKIWADRIRQSLDRNLKESK